MDWGKVVYVFFQLMSLTSVAGFLYDHNKVALFIALSLNLISTVLKIGVKNIFAAELFAASLVADLHLIPAFIYLEIKNDLPAAYAMAIGAMIANIVTIILSFIELAKTNLTGNKIKRELNERIQAECYRKKMAGEMGRGKSVRTER